LCYCRTPYRVQLLYRLADAANERHQLCTIVQLYKNTILHTSICGRGFGETPFDSRPAPAFPIFHQIAVTPPIPDKFKPEATAFGSGNTCQRGVRCEAAGCFPIAHCLPTQAAETEISIITRGQKLRRMQAKRRRYSTRQPSQRSRRRACATEPDLR
jgi:hypothetical protein